MRTVTSRIYSLLIDIRTQLYLLEHIQRFNSDLVSNY